MSSELATNKATASQPLFNFKAEVVRLRETMLENALKEFRSPETFKVLDDKIQYSDTIIYRTRTCWSGFGHVNRDFDKNIISDQLCEKLHIKSISFCGDVATLTFPPRGVRLCKLPPELTQEMIDEDIDTICDLFHPEYFEISEDESENEDEDDEKKANQIRRTHKMFVDLTNCKTSRQFVADLHIDTALGNPEMMHVRQTVWKERYATQLAERLGVDQAILEDCGYHVYINFAIN